MKDYICAIIGAAGGALASAFGGFDAGLMTLLIFMAIDYVSGLIVAGVFHSSTKTATGSLNSHVGWRGLCKKCMTLLYILIAQRLDLTLNTTFVRDMVTIAFITNELISITENAGLMGVPLPPVITRAIELLTKKSEAANDNHTVHLDD